MPGDRTPWNVPMIPEAVIAMLAVARLGAVHSVVFGGFSAESLRARIDDAEAKLVVTADGCEVITKFPAEELLVAGQRYYTVDGPLSLTRDSQSHLNTAAGRGEVVA